MNIIIRALENPIHHRISWKRLEFEISEKIIKKLVSIGYQWVDFSGKEPFGLLKFEDLEINILGFGSFIIILQINKDLKVTKSIQLSQYSDFSGSLIKDLNIDIKKLDILIKEIKELK